MNPVAWLVAHWIALAITVVAIIFNPIAGIVAGCLFWFKGLAWYWCVLIYFGIMFLTYKAKKTFRRG